MVENSDASRRDARFLEAVGFGRQEREWITQYDSFPLRDGFRSDWGIAGREPATSPFCGKHRKFQRCSETSLHGSIGGRDFYHNSVTSCWSYRCHICWKYGWAVRRAFGMESRFLTAEKVLDLPLSCVEHISASMPKELYDKPYDAMCQACWSALRRRGIIGCATVIHPFRKDKEKRDLVKSFHFHCLAYIQGGYRCRECPKNVNGVCLDLKCDGFEALTRRMYNDDGWIVKLATNELGVVEKRASVFGTCWYELEHSGYLKGAKHFQIVRWWGNVAKKEFKTVKRPNVAMCAVCKSELHDSFLPVGVRVVANRGERGFMKNFTLPHVDDKEVVKHG
jgi:hypothetical protein